MATVATLNALLRLDSSQFRRGVQEATQRAERMGRQMDQFGRTMSRRVTAPMTAAGAAATGLAVRAGRLADDLLTLETQTGLSAEALQRYRQAAMLAGADQQAMESAVESFTRRLPQIQEGTGGASDAMDRLGVEVARADGSLRDMDQVLPETLRQLADMESQTERNAVATQIFGRRALELSPLLAEGAAGLEELTNEAEELGLVIDQDALQAADAFRREWDIAREQLSVVAHEIGMELMPMIQRLVDIVQDRVVPRLREFARWLGRIDEDTLAWVAAAGAAVAAIGPLLMIVGNLTTAIVGLSRAIQGLWAALGPKGWLILGLSAAATGLIAYNRHANDARDATGHLGETMDQAVESINAMTEGMAALERQRLAEDIREAHAEVVELQGSLARAEERMAEGVRISPLAIERLEEELEDAEGHLADLVELSEAARERQEDMADESERYAEGLGDGGDSAEDLLDTLTDAASTLGDVMDLELEREGLMQEALGLAEELREQAQDETAAMEDRVEAARAWHSLQESITDEIERSVEAMGGLAAPEPTARPGTMEPSMVGRRAEPLVGDPRGHQRDAERAATAIDQAMEEAVRGIQRSFADGFRSIWRDGEEGFGALADNIVRAFQDVAAEIASALTADALGIPELMDEIRTEGASALSEAGTGLRAAGAGLVGFGVGQEAGAGAGAATGAVSGAAVAGPAGAIVGGLAGLVGGLTSSVDEVEQARREWERALDDFADMFADRTRLERMRAELEDGVGDMLEEAIRVAAAEAGTLTEMVVEESGILDDIRDTLDEEGIDVAMEQARALAEELDLTTAELEALEEEIENVRERVEEWRREQQEALDQEVAVRRAEAQGREDEAEMMRLQQRHQQELADARDAELDTDALAELHELEMARLEEAQAMEEQRRALEEQLTNLDLAAREAELWGSDIEAATARAEAARERERAEAERAFEAGDIGRETFERWADVIDGEFNAAVREAEQAALAAAQAAREQAQAERERIMEMRESLRLRLLEARGQDEAAQQLREQMEIQQFMERGADAATIALLEQVHAAERAAEATEDAASGMERAANESQRMANVMNAPMGLRASLRRFQATDPAVQGNIVGAGGGTTTQVDNSTNIMHVTVPVTGSEDPDELVEKLKVGIARKKRQGQSDPLLSAD